MKMRSLPVTVALVTVVWTVSFSLQNARAGAAMPLAAAGLPDAPSKALVEQVCGTCHGLDYLAPSTRTVAQWRDTLAVMKTSGAKASDEEVRLVFGVNEKVAQGVVAYRDKQGGFKTIKDLKQAQDLDPKKIEALKARLTF